MKGFILMSRFWSLKRFNTQKCSTKSSSHIRQKYMGYMCFSCHHPPSFGCLGIFGSRGISHLNRPTIPSPSTVTRDPLRCEKAVLRVFGRKKKKRQLRHELTESEMSRRGGSQGGQQRKSTGRLWLLGCPRKLGSMVSKWVIINGIYWGYNPLILTICYLPGTSKLGETTHLLAVN